MKGKILLILAVVLLLVLTAVPVSADWDNAKHPDHSPGDGQPGAGHIPNEPIPPQDSGHADAPGPLGPGPE